MIRLLFLLISCSLFSQEIQRQDRAVIYQDSLFVFGTDHVFASPISKPNTFSLRLIKSQININNYLPIVAHNELHFLDPLGGAVYAYELGGINRIDRSYQHRMQIEAFVMNHNDTIFKYGGYGFWSMRNFFTFFEPVSKEWEIFPPINSKEIPTGTSGNIFVEKDNKIIIFSGKQLNKNNLTDQFYNNEIWSFDFTHKTWESIGATHLDFNSFKHSIAFNDRIAFFDDKEIFVVDPFENKVEVYSQNTLHQMLIKGSRLKTIYKAGVFYCFTYSNNIEAINLVIRNEDEFFGPMVRELEMYPAFNKWWYLLSIILIVPLYVISKKIQKVRFKENKIKLNGNGLIYKKIFYSLTENELAMLDVLVKEGSVETSKILKVVENSSHNYSHNMRTKNKVLGELHYKLQTILKTPEEIIKVTKSKNDKRIIIYSLDLKYFN